MKFLFIYPNAGSQLGFNYGVAHLSSVLKSAGNDVALLQLCEEISALPSRAEFIAAVHEEKPDLVGFSVVTNQWAYTLKLAAWTRAATPAPLICGGIHAMATPEEILESGLFDYVLRGEAEEALLELVQKLDRREDITRVKNLSFVQTEKSGLIRSALCPISAGCRLKIMNSSIFNKLLMPKRAGWGSWPPGDVPLPAPTVSTTIW